MLLTLSLVVAGMAIFVSRATAQSGIYRHCKSAAALVLATALTACGTPSTQETGGGSNAADVASVDDNSAPTSGWTYDTSKDEMRGTTTKYATLVSDNKINMDFPYGEVSASLVIRDHPEYGLDVMMTVEKGQILCSSFRDSLVNIKFDDKQVKKFSCTDAEDGSSETAFIADKKTVLANIKGSKTAIIEANYYQRGAQQFTFTTVGLDWK